MDLLSLYWLAVNPAREPDPENAANEATTIEFVHEKILKGCGCSRKCFQRLPANAEEMFIHRLNVTEMAKSERDMFVMGSIKSGMHFAENTTRNRINYRYHNVEVC